MTRRARQQIRDAAKATEGSNYRVSDPITQANASFKMLESSDPIEQVVADMQIRLERLEAHDWTEGSASRAEFLLDHVALGELLHRLPRDATDADRMLLAGHGAQVRSIDNSFSTGESNALLTEQGVKIGNPSRSVKMNVIARRVFRHQRRYRVSQIGLDHLAHLKRLILAS